MASEVLNIFCINNLCRVRNMDVVICLLLSFVCLVNSNTLNSNVHRANVVSSVTYSTSGTATSTARPTNSTTPLPMSTPLIDPRAQTPVKLMDTEPLTKSGSEVEDVAVNPELNDGAIRFPREKRQTMACGCYTPAQCSNSTTDGSGLIDIRIVAGGSSTCATGLVFCCPSQTSPQISCGSRFTPTTNYILTPGQAPYGNYPWMALLQATADGSYVGGGILIDLNNVLTTAHRITRFPNGTGLRVRLGEWDQNITTEQYPYRDYTISRVWIHESFNAGTLQNDVALIRLSTSVAVNPPTGISPICMPTTSQNFESQRCWVSGWGAETFNGRFQAALRAVDVPIITPASCETALRATRLGNAWALDRSSFICAGGEQNKDACTGDGGSGLVCEVSTGRWVLAGLVAWGIGCAATGVPAAYVNVVNYLPWIQARQSQ